MTSRFRPFSMSIKVGVSLLIFNLLPNEKLNSCFDPLSPQPFSIFLDDITNLGSLSEFTNHIWTSSEEGIIDSLQYPNYYDINVAEWQKQIANKAKDEDIFKILYKTDPEDYFKNEAKLKTKNTFVKAISDDKELLPYLQFAKKCENLMANVQWDYDQTTDKYVSNANKGEMQKLVIEGTKIAETFTNPFTKYRAAYLTIKLQTYLGKKLAIKETFEKYFRKPASESWIFGSAKYYFALAHTNKLEKVILLAQTFDNSSDKRESAMRRIADMDSVSYFLPLVPNPKDRAALMVMETIDGSGPDLKNIKTIYDFNPQNQDLALLVHGEVRKLEDWLVTPEVTDYDNHYDHFFERKKDANGNDIYNQDTDPGYSFYRKEGQSQADFDKKAAEINKINRQKDINYCNEVLGFIQKVISEKKQEPYDALFLSAAAHLCFLKQDWANMNAFNDKIEKTKNTSKYVKEQAKLLTFLAKITQEKKLATPSSNNRDASTVETALVDYFEYLKNDKENPLRSKYIKNQVALYCAKEFIKKGQLPKGLLLLSKTDRLIGDYEGVLPKNIYHKLLELAQPKDYDDLLTLINKKDKTRLETFLTSDPMPYEGYSDEYYDEKEEKYKRHEHEKKWDVSKIKEYKSMYYLRRNDLQAAYNEVKTIPDAYWQGGLFQEWMNVNTFHVDMRMPHQRVDADSIGLTKKQILEKMVMLKKQLDSDPIKYADNNLQLGNAYYNMSNKGNSWLMWDVYWAHYDNNERLNEPLSIAEKYFADGMKNSKNEQISAVCYYMASICKNNWKELEAADNPYTSAFKARFPKGDKYTHLKFWCGE
jgi:hypothetical protein